MVTMALLWRCLGVLAVAFAVALVMLMGHGAWLWARRRWVTPRLARGRAALRGVAEGAEEVGPREMEVLRSLPVSLRTRLLVELSRTLSGSTAAALSRLAIELGVTQRAERLTRSRSWPRRLQGARVLTVLGGRDPVMLPLFRDSQPSVRAQAAEWAAHHPSKPAVEALLQALTRPRATHRFTVQDSLLRLGSVATEPLTRFLAERSGREAALALQLATALPHTGMLEPALKLTHDPYPPTRAGALRLLAAIGGSEGTAVALAYLDDENEEVRSAALLALSRAGDWTSAPDVASRLRDPSWEVRRSAGQALRGLGAPGLLLLRRYLHDENHFAADMARQTLDISAITEGGG